MTYKNLKVLEFYKDLPFNTYSSADEAIKNIKKINPTKIYPPLEDIIINNIGKWGAFVHGAGTGGTMMGVKQYIDDKGLHFDNNWDEILEEVL